MSKQVTLRDNARISDKDLSELIWAVRGFVERNDADVEITITFPESPKEGRWLTTPGLRGGPSVFVQFTLLSEFESLFQEYLKNKGWLNYGVKTKNEKKVA